MPKVNCPDCGAPAVRVSLRRGYKFYCSQCGWNREIARAALISMVRQGLLVVALGVILAAVVSVRNPSEQWAAGAILLAASGLPLFYVLSARYPLRKLSQSSLQPASDQASGVAIFVTRPLPGNDSKTITFQDKEFAELAMIPRPRKLKTPWKGRGYWVFALLAVALYTMYAVPATWSKLRIPHSWSGNDLVLFVPAAMVYGYFFVFVRYRIRERQLLSHGELGTGYVTAEYNGPYTQSINYRFRRADGVVIAGRCNDASRSLFAGMTVPVFYDAQDPQRSIPLDASMTTIAAL
jgi:hypothetical protein